MMNYCGNRWGVARFVDAAMQRLGPVLQSITITYQEKYEVYCVSVVTDTLWVATVEELATTYFLERINISQDNTPGG